MSDKSTSPSIWTAPDQTSGKLIAPAAERNKAALLEVLQKLIPGDEPVDVLEVAAGTGQHAAYFATNRPHANWWPVDLDPAHIASIKAYQAECGLANVHVPQRVDVTVRNWAAQTRPVTADFVLCCNMIHIAPWAACLGLLVGVGEKLVPGGRLMLYGPFMRQGVATAPSNEAFDASLKARNPDWGLRLLEDVSGAAEAHGLNLEKVIEMPANNLSVVFRKDAAK